MRAIFIDSIYIYDQKHIEVKFTFEDVVKDVVVRLAENTDDESTEIAG